MNDAIQTLMPAAFTALLAVSVCAQGFAAPAPGGAKQLTAPTQGAWPRIRIQQGKYFSFATPAGWRVNETTNGVDILSPDEHEGVGFVGLEGAPGTSSPENQIRRMGQVLHLSNLKYQRLHQWPSKGGFDSADYLVSYTSPKGLECEGWVWCAVFNTFGRSSRYMDYATATTAEWGRDSQFLAAAARLVRVTNPAQAFQRDQLIRLHVSVGPGSAGGLNHPNTFTPYSHDAAMARISDQYARTTRDDYPLTEPSTGETYHGTSGNYDYVRGGWVNPHDSTQLLQVVPLGR